MNTKNMTKADLRTVLEGYRDVVKDKSLSDRISYTLNKYGQSTKKVVLDLMKDIESSLTPAPLPVENSVKPSLKKKTKVDKSEKTEEPEVTEPVEEPKKKTPKKSAGKKSTLSKPKPVRGATDKSATMSAIFPEKIEDENIGTLVAVPNKYRSMQSLREAVESGEKTVVIAAYFPLPLVRKYGYSSTAECDNRVPKKGFAHDLDLQQVIYCCEGLPRAYALSDYTEAMFYYDENMLEPIPTKDSATGEEVLTRFANGCEFEIYELVEEQ